MSYSFWFLSLGGALVFFLACPLIIDTDKLHCLLILDVHLAINNKPSRSQINIKSNVLIGKHVLLHSVCYVYKR